MKAWLRLGLVVVAVVALLFVLRATLFRPKPVEVEAVAVARGIVEDAVTNSQAGTVRSHLQAKVGAERAGRIVSLPHREGDDVRRGDVLLSLDASTATTRLSSAQRDLEASRAGVEAAVATARQARQDFERIDRLARSGAVSREQLDQARTRLDSAEADLKAARARVGGATSAVRLARDELDHLNVTAPFDGVITQRFIEVGESVVPGQPVFEIMSPSALYVVAPIDEIDIGRISRGLPARVTLDPFPDVTWNGQVTRVAEFVNDVKEQNRTLDVEVDIRTDSDKPRPKPGTSADVEIILDERSGVLRVPTFSVIEGKRVLVAQSGKAVSRDVVTGIRNWEWTEIKSGLTEGELVITNLDKQGIAPGVRVKVQRKDLGPAGAGEVTRKESPEAGQAARPATPPADRGR